MKSELEIKSKIVSVLQKVLEKLCYGRDYTLVEATEHIYCEITGLGHENITRILKERDEFGGLRYKVFQVAGDSMEPVLKEYYYVIAEKINQDYWQWIANFEIYVIITEDRLMVKRLYKIPNNDKSYIVISDNEKYYPQYTIDKSEILELYMVRMKVDSELKPHKKFKIAL